ncbi:MAG: lysine N(6)-hydroxylase/L-ornithine N(5)-oxygenase family protein [Anaerolineae bacterium]|nr:lysine N(6)-hydroxylase/L-ornithine N(5)-oxygenase family protein [Anaerolineae bacterium]
MLDWLIVGGGIHGTHLSLYLTQRRGVQSVRVLDPHPQPLALWRRFTTNTGMEFLRSPHAHNLHFDPFSLVTFARTQVGEPLARFIEPYGRPALELFNTHSDRLIDRYKLADLRLTGRLQGLTRLTDGWRAETDNGAVEARRVVLCIGMTEQPYWPEWAHDLGTNVHHIFDPTFSREDLPLWKQALVVGGGITAAQTAIALALRAPGTVTLLMRHTPRIHQFDSDTGWITPHYLDGFYHLSDYTARRKMIVEARHRGSLPVDVAKELERAVQDNLLIQQTDEVVGAQRTPSGINLHLASGDHLTTDCLVLATGFTPHRPGGEWLDVAIQNYELPTAPDGYPIIDRTLCWSPGLYVTGPLAELEIGPVARNFIGARLASERIGEILR